MVSKRTSAVVGVRSDTDLIVVWTMVVGALTTSGLVRFGLGHVLPVSAFRALSADHSMILR